MYHAISLEKKLEINSVVKAVESVLNKYSREHNSNFKDAILVFNIVKAHDIELKK